MAQAQTGARGAGKKSPAAQFEEQPTPVKVLLLILLLTLLGVVYYFVLHMDLGDEIESAEHQHRQLQSDLVTANQRQAEYLRVTAELAEREQIDRMNKRVLPEKAEIPAFLDDVNRVAELSGLTIKRVEPKDEVNETKYVRVPMVMVMEGRFHQFAKYFYNIGRLERAASTRIRSIRYQPPAQGAQGQQPRGALPEVKLVVELEATAFRRAGVDAPGGM